MRARGIKPGFFKNEELADLPPLTRILFAGLWGMADREGRLEDRPKRIKAEVLPYDDCSVDDALDQLAAKRFLLRYRVDGHGYVQINNFLKHQQPHYKEAASEIPPPDGHRDSEYPGGAIPRETREQVMARDKSCRECGADTDLTIDHIVPQSKGGTHAEDNLRVLCRRCNSAKNNRLASGNVEPTSSQLRTEHGSNKVLHDPLTPDSGLLTPDSGLLTPVTDPDPAFADFWKLYPKKQDKGHAEKAWRVACKEAPPGEIIAGLRAQLPELKTREAKYIPLAATWLNGKRWADELPRAKTGCDAVDEYWGAQRDED